MTDSMKAVVLTRFGGADAFELRDVPVPHVGPRQVRVRVHATAVNPLDYQIRRGDYADHVPLPAIIGHDISGVIEEVGSHVTEFRTGDEVYYTPQIFGGPGSYAEQHVADVDLVGRKPENISHLEAASLTLVGGTVWEALVTRAQLAVGETILIHGGAGGVGTIAIQIANGDRRTGDHHRESRRPRVRALSRSGCGDRLHVDRLRRCRGRADGRHGRRRRLRHDRWRRAHPKPADARRLRTRRQHRRHRAAAEPHRGVGQERRLSLRLHTTEPRKAGRAHHAGRARSREAGHRCDSSARSNGRGSRTPGEQAVVCAPRQGRDRRGGRTPLRFLLASRR